MDFSKLDQYIIKVCAEKFIQGYKKEINQVKDVTKKRYKKQCLTNLT